MKFRELPTAAMGRIGEIAASREFRRDGFGVFASFKFSGESDDEAPAIEIDENRREIVPDLDLCKRGERFWVEVKTYGEAAWNRRFSCWMHGISVRHFDNYVAVEARTGSSVFLAINEIKTGLLLFSNRPLSAMQKYACLCGCDCDPKKVHRDHGSGVRGPQWYFDRDTFTARYRFDKKTIENLRNEHARLIKPSHVAQRHGEVREPPRQQSLFASLDDGRASDPLRRGHR